MGCETVTLTDRAFIVCDLGDRTGTFEVSVDLEPSQRVSHRYLIGNAGQRISEAFRLLADGADGELDENIDGRRVGYTLDAGAGEWGGSLTFSTGLEDVRWGDGSGGTGPGNVTEFDASGADVDPISRLDVLGYWLANTRTDSQGNMRIHYGEWTNGDVPGVTGVDAGVYAKPKVVSLLDAEFRSPEEDVTRIRGTLNYRRTSDANQLPDEVADAISDLINNTELSQEIPDA